MTEVNLDVRFLNEMIDIMQDVLVIARDNSKLAREVAELRAELRKTQDVGELVWKLERAIERTNNLQDISDIYINEIIIQEKTRQPDIWGDIPTILVIDLISRVLDAMSTPPEIRRLLTEAKWKIQQNTYPGKVNSG